jgi:hypothetical protein
MAEPTNVDRIERLRGPVIDTEIPVAVGPVRRGRTRAPRTTAITAGTPASSAARLATCSGSACCAIGPAYGDQRAETLAQIDAIVSAGETPAELPLHVVIGLTTRD